MVWGSSRVRSQLLQSVFLGPQGELFFETYLRKRLLIINSIIYHLELQGRYAFSFYVPNYDQQNIDNYMLLAQNQGAYRGYSVLPWII